VYIKSFKRSEKQHQIFDIEITGMFSYNNTLPCVNKTDHICPWADIGAKI
jgi:hypothetical protein